MPDECRLTTIDNPYDPFDDFINWFMFDISKGYNTCSYLARIAIVGDDFSDAEVNREIERAIDEIVELNPLGIYTKIRKGEFDKFTPQLISVT